MNMYVLDVHGYSSSLVFMAEDDDAAKRKVLSGELGSLREVSDDDIAKLEFVNFSNVNSFLADTPTDRGVALGLFKTAPDKSMRWDDYYTLIRCADGKLVFTYD